MLYSVSSWIFGPVPIERTLPRLSALGYGAVELKGEPAVYDVPALRGVLESEGLRVSSICGMYPGPAGLRDLSHPDREERQRAVDYVRSCVDLAEVVGAPLVIVTPNPVGKTRPLAPVAEEWAWALDSVRVAGEYAAGAGVLLAIEPINRYETYLINSGTQGLKFVREVGLPSVQLMLDTFHMNIEDPGAVETVRLCTEALIHLHIADSNRQSVGRGHFDFAGLMRTLQEIGYQGALAMEPLPPLPDPYLAMQSGFSSDLLDVYLGECLAQLSAYERVAQEKGD